jgi:hypothetical protein
MYSKISKWEKFQKTKRGTKLKKYALTLCLLLAFILTGCGQEAANSEQKTEAEKQEVEKEEEKLTAEEVLSQATEKSKELKNFEMNGTLNMTMTAAEQTNETEMKMDTKTSIDPFFMHQKMNMDVDGQPQSVEMYINQEYMYIQSPGTEEWTKIKQVGQVDLQQLLEEQQSVNPIAQLEQMKEFADDIQLEENENEYILNVNGNGDKLMDLIGGLVGSGMDQAQLEAIMSQMKIEKIDYSYSLDKETMEPKSLQMDLTMKITENEETVSMNQKVNFTFSNINQLKDLTIPEEIENNAVETNPVQ